MSATKRSAGARILVRARGRVSGTRRKPRPTVGLLRNRRAKRGARRWATRAGAQAPARPRRSPPGPSRPSSGPRPLRASPFAAFDPSRLPRAISASSSREWTRVIAVSSRMYVCPGSIGRSFATCLLRAERFAGPRAASRAADQVDKLVSLTNKRRELRHIGVSPSGAGESGSCMDRSGSGTSCMTRAAGARMRSRPMDAGEVDSAAYPVPDATILSVEYYHDGGILGARAPTRRGRKSHGFRDVLAFASAGCRLSRSVPTHMSSARTRRRSACSSRAARAKAIGTTSPGSTAKFASAIGTP